MDLLRKCRDVRDEGDHREIATSRCGAGNSFGLLLPFLCSRGAAALAPAFLRGTFVHFLTASGTALLAALVRLVDRGPGAGLGRFLGHAAFFVTLLDVL